LEPSSSYKNQNSSIESKLFADWQKCSIHYTVSILKITIIKQEKVSNNETPNDSPQWETKKK